jgi:hypothetical protein
MVIRRIQWKIKSSLGGTIVTPYFKTFTTDVGTGTINFDIGFAVSNNSFQLQVLGSDGRVVGAEVEVWMQGYFVTLTSALPAIDLLLLGKGKAGFPASRLLASPATTGGFSLIMVN